VNEKKGPNNGATNKGHSYSEFNGYPERASTSMAERSIGVSRQPSALCVAAATRALRSPTVPSGGSGPVAPDGILLKASIHTTLRRGKFSLYIEFGGLFILTAVMFDHFEILKIVDIWKQKHPSKLRNN